MSLIKPVETSESKIEDLTNEILEIKKQIKELTEYVKKIEINNTSKTAVKEESGSGSGSGSGSCKIGWRGGGNYWDNY